MILTYHKIATNAIGGWYVGAKDFKRQILELEGYKFVNLDDYNPKIQKQIVLTFDDGYLGVLKFTAPYLFKRKIPFEVFIVGDLIGKTNSWEKSEPVEKMCSIQDLKKIIKFGGRLQWHTKSHVNFSRVSDNKKILDEITVPSETKDLDKKGFNWFAYPYGIASPIAIDLVKKKFVGAVTCTDGDSGNRYLLPRLTVKNTTSFALATPEINFYINSLEIMIENNKHSIEEIQKKVLTNRKLIRGLFSFFKKN